jgi:23S rRNA (cytosine1962-C5)-methyltransferase
VHAEADLLPSLIVDRYGDWLVIQTLSQGMDRRIDDIVRLLVEILHPVGVLARNDPRVRALEGLEQTIGVVYGEVPETIEIEELGIRSRSIPGRDRRRTVSGSAGEPCGRCAMRRGRVLDAFSYNGGLVCAWPVTRTK